MKRRVGISLLALALAGGPVSVAPAAAQAVVSTGESFVSTRFAVGERHSDGSREAGLRLSVAPGWKTYWRNPGEAGVPPHFDWSGSKNLASVEIDWPAPKTFDSFGMRTLGYAGEVILPMRLVPEDPAEPISLALDVTLGVCKEICVLEQSNLAAAIPPDAVGADAGAIAAARASVPQPAAEQGLTAAHCRIIGAGETRRFEAELSFSRPVSDPVVVLEGPENSWFRDTKVTTNAGSVAVTADISLFGGPSWIDRKDLRMTVLAGDFSADVKGCTAPAG